MQIFNLTTNQLIDKLIAFVTYIITFFKTTFNNIIAIRNVDFHLGNILNSSGIIIQFILSIFLHFNLYHLFSFYRFYF
uniref:Uncharacterized protein n=1 Tax=Candidatus Phytoplasma tritici TaxID=321961 RepID=K7W4T8_9MOLU|nr:hypothetical protein [Candidatus Phytoplasma tritici]